MHSMALSASAPRSSADSSWPEPKLSRKSLTRSLLSFLAARAAIVSIMLQQPASIGFATIRLKFLKITDPEIDLFDLSCCASPVRSLRRRPASALDYRSWDPRDRIFQEAPKFRCVGRHFSPFVQWERPFRQRGG